MQHGVGSRPVRRRRAGEDLTACLDLHVGAGAAVVPGPQQELPARDQLVGHAAGAGITGEAVAGERGARRAGAAVARLQAVADSVVVAGRPVDLWGVFAAGARIAAVGRARVAIRALERVAAVAEPVQARLEAVTDVGVGARRAVGQRRSRAALLVLAALDAVADVAVVTCCAGRRRRSRGAHAALAGLLSVARIVIAALRAIYAWHVLAADGLVARVDGALVVIVARWRRAAAADACRARLVAVAWIAVAARRAVGRPLSRRAHARVAGLEAVAREAVAARASLGRNGPGDARTTLAGIGAVAGLGVAAWRAVGGRCSRRADARVARLRAVAGISVAARRPVRTQGARDAHATVADVVVRARVPGVAAGALAQRRSLLADAALAHLGAVARVAVAAGGPVQDRGVLASEDIVARIHGTGAGVGALKGRSRQTDSTQAALGAVAGLPVRAIQVGGTG